MKSKIRFSLRLKGLKYELQIAFCLVLIAVLTFLGYLFPGTASVFSPKTHLVYVSIFASLVVFLAFVWIKQVMVNPVIKINDEAKKIVEGDYSREIKLTREDEIGQLSNSLNRMSSRIREDMEELKTFSEKTERVNVEINKRILSLSGLLQVSNLVAQNAELEDVIQVGFDRCLSATEMTLGCVILKNRQTNEYGIKTLYGPRKEEIILKGAHNVIVKLGQGVLGKTMLRQEPITIDRNTKETPDVKEFKEFFCVTSAVVIPIISRNKIRGLFVAGNEKARSSLSENDNELLNLLVKQIAIAIENSLLATKVEKLEITDSLTGLFNSAFVHGRLNEEIKRAINFQRPCAFVVLSLDKFRAYHESFGRIAAENLLIKIAALLRESVNEIYKIARFGDHEFALILPERNKRQAIEIAEELRKKIEYVFSEEDDQRKKITCTGAVAENPVDGMSADELIHKAREILDAALKQGGNRICYKI